MNNCLNKFWTTENVKKGNWGDTKKNRKTLLWPEVGGKRKENGFFRNKTEQSEAGTKTLWSLVLSSLVMGAQVLRGSVPWNRVSDLWVDMVRLFLLKKWRLNPTAASEKKAVAEAMLTGTWSKQRRPFSSSVFLVPLHAHHWQKLTEPDGKAEM